MASPTVVRTVKRYPLNGSIRDFDISFDYLARKFVVVSLVDTSGTLERRQLVNVTDYRFTTKNSIQTTVAHGAEGYDEIEIRRVTSTTERVVDFADGSVLRAQDLNAAQVQAMHIAEEGRDQALLSISVTDSGQLDAHGMQIINVAPGTSPSDAINKDQLDTTLGEIGGVLDEVEETKQWIKDYIDNFVNDTANLKNVLWVYNGGIAIGGETEITVTKEGSIVTIPALYINGDRQERGWQFDYSSVDKKIILSKPLKSGDFVACLTAEGSTPIMDLLASTEGASNIGTTNGKTVQERIDELTQRIDSVTNLQTINVLSHGAVGDGVHDDYPAFQKALLKAHELGGAVVEIPTPKVEWRIGFPLYLFSNTSVKGSGVNCRINFVDPLYSRKSRSGFVIGSGYEQNRDKAIQCLRDGTWATTGSVVDTSFVEPARGEYIRDHLDRVQSANCSISDVYLVATYPNGTTLKGGYAVSGANAIDSVVYNVWAEGFTEIINFGSDVPPATPSCHNLHAWDIVSVKPNDYETYYSAGFIANSTMCTIRGFKQLKPIADGSPHGSGASLNYTEDCGFYDFHIPSLGRTASSEGILVNNSKGAVVHNVTIGNAKTGVAEYYTTGAGIFYDRTRPNVFSNIHANNCDNAVALRSKFSVWKDITQTNCTYHVYFGTTNAQACDVKFVPDSLGFGNNVDGLARIRDNKVAGYRERSVYLRSIGYLVEDKASLRSWDLNRTMKLEDGVGCHILYPVPPYMRAILSVNQKFTFEVNSQAKGSKVTVQVRRLATFSGNSNESPVIEFENSRTASVNSVQDTDVQTNAPRLVVNSPDDGIPNSMDVLVTVENPAVNMNIKEARIVYLGD